MKTEVPKQDDKGNPVDYVAINEAQMTAIMTGLRSCTKKQVPELMQMAYMPDDLPPSRFNFRGVSVAHLRQYQLFHALMGTRAFIKWMGADFYRDVIEPAMDYYVAVYPPLGSDIPTAVKHMIQIDIIPMVKLKLRAMRRSMEARYASGRSY